MMLSDNFNTVEVRHSSERGSPFSRNESPEAQSLGEQVFHLQTYQVSTMTKQLMDLVYSTLDEVADVTPET